MHTLTRLLSEAFERSGLSVAGLLSRSGLPLERSTLQRKLSGDVRMTVDEMIALAAVLDVRVPRRIKTLARSAKAVGLDLVFPARAAA